MQGEQFFFVWNVPPHHIPNVTSSEYLKIIFEFEVVQCNLLALKDILCLKEYLKS